MLLSRNLYIKSSEVSIKARSTKASLSFKGQATKHTIVKWSSVRKTTVDAKQKYKHRDRPVNYLERV